MRRLSSLVLGLAFILATASTALSQGTLANSLHDFRGQTWSGGDFCKVCHTPHSTLSATAPLWNHDLSSQTFTMYTSTTSNTLDGTVDAQPTGESAVCLGCHDGLTALNAYGGATVDPVTSPTTMSDLILSNPNSITGIDLTNDHPISIDYASAITNGDATLHPETTAGVAALLRSGKVQCASCHDPHGVPGVAKFVRIDNTGSALCLTCHNK